MMTKGDLVRGVATRSGLSQMEARLLVDGLVSLISDELADGADIFVTGLGRFSVGNRAARQGRNPATGEMLQIAPSKTVRFSADSSLSGRLSQPSSHPVRIGGRAKTRSGGRAKSRSGAQAQRRDTGRRAGARPDERAGGPTDIDRRPRFLVAQGPEKVSLDERFSLLVRVTLRGPGSQLNSFEVPKGGLPVLLVAHAPGLQAVSGLRETVHVPYDCDSEPVMFEFKPERLGVHQISVSAWNGGAYLGELGFDIAVEARVTKRADAEIRKDMSVATDEGHVRLVVRFDPHHQSYRFEFHDIDNPNEVSATLTYDPSDALEDLVNHLNDLAGAGAASQRRSREFLVNAGVNLWRELIPKALRDQFWERRSRITRLTILTEADRVPWELLYPKDPGRDFGFLVEQFQVMRGVFDRYPSRRLRFSPARFVLPTDSPLEAAGEIEAIRNLLKVRQSRQAIVSRLDQLTTLIERGRFGLLHFACHNGLSNAIVLDDEFTPLLMETTRVDRTLARSSPFVFINACGAARGIPKYNRLDSWATAFLDAGAAAFAGSLWDVRDRTAKDFAEALYGELVGGRTLGEAVLSARRLASSSVGDPTWLAYAVYGDADAKADRATR